MSLRCRSHASVAPRIPLAGAAGAVYDPLGVVVAVDGVTDGQAPTPQRV